MYGIDLLLDLPVALSCRIVSDFLHVKDVARLDSACCYVAVRNVLFGSILSTPSCVLSDDLKREDLHNNMHWLATRDIRASTIHLNDHTDAAECDAYLQKHGKHVRSACFHDFRSGGTGMELLMLSLAQYGVHLEALRCVMCDFCAAIARIFANCVKLNYVGLESVGYELDEDSGPTIFDAPTITQMSLKYVRLACCEKMQQWMFKMLVRERVETLVYTADAYFGINQVPNWCKFTNLTNLCFEVSSDVDDATLLHIFTSCPQICKLEVKITGFTERLSGEGLAAIAPIVNYLQFLALPYNRAMTDQALYAIARYHHSTLEVLQIHGCTNVTADAINHVLLTCTALHAIGYSFTHSIDYSLMANITTIETSYTHNDNVWQAIQIGCKSLRCLHIHFNPYIYSSDEDISGLAAAVCEMPTLRSMYLSKINIVETHPVVVMLRHYRPDLTIVNKDFDISLKK